MSDHQALKIANRAVANGIVLFQRPRSGMWQARIRHSSGKWLVVSTGQIDFDQARLAAISKHNEILKAVQQGGVVFRFCPSH